MVTLNIQRYFYALVILSALGLIISLIAIILVLLQVPIYHTLLKLGAVAVFQGIILNFALKRKVAAFVIAFLLNLYEIIYAYHVGIIYDIFNFHAAILSYINFIIMIATLIMSGLGLYAYFKNRKLTNV